VGAFDQLSSDQFPPYDACQYEVVAVVKAEVPSACIVFPPQSPEPFVAEDKSQLAVPAPVMSIKSALDIEVEEAVIVRGVPTVFD
jgi:hypothetical protein